MFENRPTTCQSYERMYSGTVFWLTVNSTCISSLCRLPVVSVCLKSSTFDGSYYSLFLWPTSFGLIDVCARFSWDTVYAWPILEYMLALTWQTTPWSPATVHVGPWKTSPCWSVDFLWGWPRLCCTLPCFRPPTTAWPSTGEPTSGTDGDDSRIGGTVAPLDEPRRRR